MGFKEGMEAALTVASVSLPCARMLTLRQVLVAVDGVVAKAVAFFHSKSTGNPLWFWLNVGAFVVTLPLSVSAACFLYEEFGMAFGTTSALKAMVSPIEYVLTATAFYSISRVHSTPSPAPGAARDEHPFTDQLPLDASLMVTVMLWFTIYRTTTGMRRRGMMSGLRFLVTHDPSPSLDPGNPQSPGWEISFAVFIYVFQFSLPGRVAVIRLTERLARTQGHERSFIPIALSCVADSLGVPLFAIASVMRSLSPARAVVSRPRAEE